MPTKKAPFVVTLTKSNAEMAAIAAALLKTSIEEVVSLCLKGSTNPMALSHCDAE